MDVRAGKSGGRASSVAKVGRELKERSRCAIDVKTGGVSVESKARGKVDEIWLWERMSFWRWVRAVRGKTVDKVVKALRSRLRVWMVVGRRMVRGIEEILLSEDSRVSILGK